MPHWIDEVLRLATGAGGVALLGLAWKAVSERRSARRDDRSEALHLAMLLYQWIAHAAELRQAAIDAGAEFLPDPPTMPGDPYTH